MISTDLDIRPPRSRGVLMAVCLALALACAGFVTLGLWQVQRLAWKEALVDRVARLSQAAPVAAPGPQAWPGLQRQEDEYRRVLLQGEFDHSRETLVAATTALGGGYWVLTPMRTLQGPWVLVNRGFVPPELRDRRLRRADEPHGPQGVVGLLRFSEPHGRLWQQNDAAGDRWYSRDVAAIAAARELVSSAGVAPYFVDAVAPEAPAAAAAWPRAGLTVLQFSNNHRVYAATWFALAAMAACAIGYLLLDDRRLRRLAGERPVIRATERSLPDPRG